jgi:hypothetical protein
MTTIPDATFPCPKCGKVLSVPLAEIAPGASKPCPHCGTAIKFAGQDASKIQRIVEQIEGEVPGARVKVTVRTQTERRRPWWRFWERS